MKSTNPFYRGYVKFLMPNKHHGLSPVAHLSRGTVSKFLCGRPVVGSTGSWKWPPVCKPCKRKADRIMGRRRVYPR